jgi:hypothetical protein
MLDAALVKMPSLSVLVIGGSVTGGGGVGNDPTRAWHAQLGNVKPTVNYKSAITPAHFLHCTDRFVDHDHYDVVLFDLGANMFGGASEAHLVQLVERIRCLSNAPSTAILHWPGLMDGNATQRAALRSGATLLEVPHGHELYSKDRVHPNAQGHARIAQRVKLYLKTAHWDATSNALDCPAPRSEACFSNALDLPVARKRVGDPRNWKLVDDSPTPDKVHKFGWMSSTAGANLTLAIPQDDECGAVVTLAYLTASDTGPFKLTCEPGCTCAPLRMTHQWRAFPFPIVTGQEEWQGVCSDCNRVKATKETAFNLLREGRETCRVTVTVLSPRRVRLDGLYVQVPEEAHVKYTRFPPANPGQRRFGAHALDKNCEPLGS